MLVICFLLNCVEVEKSAERDILATTNLSKVVFCCTALHSFACDASLKLEGLINLVIKLFVLTSFRRANLICIWLHAESKLLLLDEQLLLIDARVLLLRCDICYWIRLRLRWLLCILGVFQQRRDEALVISFIRLKRENLFIGVVLSNRLVLAVIFVLFTFFFKARLLFFLILLS